MEADGPGFHFPAAGCEAGQVGRRNRDEAMGQEYRPGLYCPCWAQGSREGDQRGEVFQNNKWYRQRLGPRATQERHGPHGSDWREPAPSELAQSMAQGSKDGLMDSACPWRKFETGWGSGGVGKENPWPAAVGR